MRTIDTMIKKLSQIFAFVMLGLLSGCDDDDPPLPDNLVQFEAEELGFDSDERTLTINITLSRPASEVGTVIIGSTLTGVTYETDFTTSPAIAGGTFTITIPKGETGSSFEVTKKEGVLLDGDESISFNISGADESLVMGEKSGIVVSFSQILATQATMDPGVGGQLQPNKVFVDLSANRQSSFNRGDWDLGFYTVDGQFRVILNSSTAMMAKALDKNDLTAVTVSDTVGLGAQLSSDAIFGAITSATVPGWVTNSLTWIDDPSGDVTKTAIAEIGSNAGDNKVYIINRGKKPDGSQRGWKKIRVIRNGNNYTLQHADINAATFTTVEVSRNTDYLFNYVKFEEGVKVIEPEKEKWDIAFTVFTNTTPAGPTLTVPYVFSDIVLQNRFAVETAELMIATAGTYQEFGEEDLSAVTYGKSQLSIGSKWRSGGGPGSAPAVREDGFYLVKDADGNIYKLRFTALSQNGERGRPKIEFMLIKRG